MIQKSCLKKKKPTNSSSVAKTSDSCLSLASIQKKRVNEVIFVHKGFPFLSPLSEMYTQAQTHQVMLTEDVEMMPIVTFYCYFNGALITFINAELKLNYYYL